MTMKIEKYKVSQELMNEINEWSKHTDTDSVGFSVGDIYMFPNNVTIWWNEIPAPSERNNRLIALIQYVNGEDVFEVEKPKKWVIRSKKRTYDDDYKVIALYSDNGFITTDLERAYTVDIVYGLDLAFKFDSKEEAEKWTNPLMEVVEVDG